MPVSPAVFAAFCLASLALLVIPGPTIIMVISQALAHGRRVAVASLLGVTLGDLVVTSLSILGVGTILAASAAVFTAVKWIGAAYLVYIGVKMWRTPVTVPDVETAELAALDRRHVFRDAFLVTALNPKSIVFFMAFVPQFIAHDRPFAPQAIVFAATFILLATATVYVYIQIASSARRLIRRPAVIRRATRTGAGFLIGAGIASAFAQRAA
jgi:threonine/homoserine/homoserine lactone efflux protein